MTDATWNKIAEREIARPVACEILSGCACTPGYGIYGAAEMFGVPPDDPAVSLAMDAWVFVAEKLGWRNHRSTELYAIICGNAETLLQRGWSRHVPEEWC